MSMVNEKAVKMAIKMAFGPGATPEAVAVGDNTQLPEGWQPEGSKYALLYKRPADESKRLPYDNVEALKKWLPEDIKDAGFTEHGDNFAWDKVYWMFQAGDDKVNCVYSCSQIGVDGQRNSNSLQSITCEKDITDPEGKPLTVAYLEKAFGGDFPFTGNRIALQKFSNGNTAVVAEPHDQLLNVPEGKAVIGRMPQFFREHGKPLSDLMESIGSYRVWVGSDVGGHLAKITGEPDPRAQAAIQSVLSKSGAPAASTPANNTPPPLSGEQGMEEKEASTMAPDISNTSKGNLALSKVEKNLASATQGTQSRSHADLANTYKKNYGILSNAERDAKKQASVSSVLMGWSKQKS